MSLGTQQHFGRTQALSAQVTVSTTPAYAANDLVGGLLTFPFYSPGNGGLIHSLTLLNLNATTPPLDVLLFSGSLGATTLTDNSPLAVADADLLTFLGHIPVAAADYAALADNSVATVRGVGLTFQTPSTPAGALYGVLRANGTAVFTGTLDLRLTLHAHLD